MQNFYLIYKLYKILIVYTVFLVWKWIFNANEKIIKFFIYKNTYMLLLTTVEYLLSTVATNYTFHIRQNTFFLERIFLNPK